MFHIPENHCDYNFNVNVIYCSNYNVPITVLSKIRLTYVISLSSILIQRKRVAF